MTPAILDTQWSAFREIAQQQQKLPGSSEHWREAMLVWRTLDGFQRQAAIEHLGRCDGYETTHARPAKYLRYRMWEVAEPVPRERVKDQPKALDGALARLQREVKR